MNKNKLIFLVFTLLYGCDHSSSIQVKKIVPAGEVSTKTAEASQAEKNRAEIRALMRKAHAGDGEAAYDLSVKSTFGPQTIQLSPISGRLKQESFVIPR